MPTLSKVFSNLHSLVKAGVALAPGCRKLAETSNTKLKTIWTDLAEKLEAGFPLSAVLAKSTLPVDPWMIDMMEAGEASGTVDQILHYLVDELEAHSKWKRTLTMRMLYPVVLLHLTALLPAIPIALNHGGVLAITWICFFLMIIYVPLVGYWILIRASRQSSSLKQTIEYTQLKLPVIGPGLRAMMAARFYRALSALARASSRWEDAIVSAAKASNSIQLYQSSHTHTKAFLQGNDLTSTLQKFHFFTDQDIDILTTGEVTGTLDDTLERLSTSSWEIATTRLKLFSMILTVGVYGLCIVGVLLSILTIIGPVYYQVYELLNI